MTEKLSEVIAISLMAAVKVIALEIDDLRHTLTDIDATLASLVGAIEMRD